MERHSRVVIYNCNVFTIQATGFTLLTGAMEKLKLCHYLL
jgi:hypothetical protein